jgi:hypothetical protein
MALSKFFHGRKRINGSPCMIIGLGKETKNIYLFKKRMAKKMETTL